MNTNSSEIIIARLKEVFSVTSDSSLCDKLSVSPQTLSSWKSRNKIPYANCVEISIQKNVSLDWLLTGRGEMYLSTNAKAVDNCSSCECLNDDVNMRARRWLDIFETLDEEGQKNILQDIEKEKQQTELRQQLKGLQDTIEELKRAI